MILKSGIDSALYQMLCESDIYDISALEDWF